MELTPAQQDQVRHAKDAGEKRVTVRFTPEQKSEWQETLAQELADKEGNVANFRKIVAATEQPGFFGDVRRAILLSRRVCELSAEIGVDERVFSDFRAGEAELPAAALDRLIDALGLRLMRDISR